jgi:periplasmic protein CpxP/Spy
METTRFYKWLIVVLVLINVVILSFFTLKGRHEGHGPRGGGEVGEFISEELHFSDSQKKQFEDMKHQHHEAMMSLQEKNKELHDEFFEHLATPQDSSVNALSDSIASLQKQMDMVTFNHFKDVRALCTPEQQTRFDQIIDEALHRLHGPPRH